MKRTIISEIMQAQNAIQNALTHKEIQKKMEVCAYDRKKLLEGKSLYEKVRMLQSAKQDKYGSQYTTSDTFRADIMQVKNRYMRHLKIARLAFGGNRGVEEILQIRGKRKADMDSWLDQVHTFYSKIEAYNEEIVRYNVTAEELVQTGAMAEALYTSRQQQLQKKGDAQHATHQRDEARKALRIWISRFRKASRLALQDDPQLLEVLGIQVVSRVS